VGFRVSEAKCIGWGAPWACAPNVEVKG